MIEKENSIGFKDFCENTSLHGWGIMSFGGFKVRQILFWLFAIIGGSHQLIGSDVIALMGQLMALTN